MHRRQFLEIAACLGASSALAGNLSAIDSSSVHATLDAAAYQRLRRYAKTVFGDVAYLDQGHGDAALFLHGFPLNSFQWRGAIERLSSYRRCIAPDFLGMGYTRVAAGQSLVPDEQMKMLIALLDYLKIGAVDVIANDSGGAVAQLLMAHHPQRVRSALLTNGDTEMESPPSAMAPVIELARQGKYADQWLAPWKKDKVLARSASGIGAMCYANPQHPTDEAIDMYFGPLLASHESVAMANAYAVALERNALSGIEAALQRSRMPVRIVWGRSDGIFAKKNADYLDYACGGSRGIRWLDDSKLFWPEERPEVIAQEALALWNV